MPAIQEGSKAPSFVLSDGAGKRVALDDFKGRDVVVYFYPRDAAAHPADVLEAVRGQPA